MLPSVLLLSKQLPDDRKYVDLDHAQIISQQTSFTKRFICNTPRFASNDLQLFNRVCSIIQDTSPEIKTAPKVAKAEQSSPANAPSLPSMSPPISLQPPGGIKIDPISNGAPKTLLSPPLFAPFKMEPTISPSNQSSLFAPNKQPLFPVMDVSNSKQPSLFAPMDYANSKQPPLFAPMDLFNNKQQPAPTPYNFQLSLPLNKGNIRSIQTAKASLQITNVLQTNDSSEKSNSETHLQRCFDKLPLRGGPGGQYLNLDTGNINAVSTIKGYKLPYMDATLLIGGSNKSTFDLIKAVIRDFDIETPIIEGIADDTKITKALRFSVWKMINGNVITAPCFCCSGDTTYDVNYEAGHIKSRAKGGVADIDNLRPICRQCNRSMGTTEMKEYAKKNHLTGRIMS